MRALEWLALSPRLEGLRGTAGRALDAVDHPQLRQARLLLRTTPDVVLLGESVLSFVGAHDHDRRTVPAMVADALGPSVSVVAVHGGGYHADLLAAFVELLAHRRHRPRVVVAALWVRGRLRPWVVHPRFGHVDAVRRLRALDPATPPWRVRGSLRRGGAEAFADFHRTPYATLLGPGTVGDYAVPLRGSELIGQERLRRLYAYHHGGELVPGDPDVAAFTRLGSSLRALGSPYVVYQAPVSVITGTEVLGEAFRDRVEQNFRVADDALRAGTGAPTPVLQTGCAFDPEEFLDPSDGSEHLNEHGRRRLADLLVAQVRARLP